METFENFSQENCCELNYNFIFQLWCVLCFFVSRHTKKFFFRKEKQTRNFFPFDKKFSSFFRATHEEFSFLGCWVTLITLGMRNVSNRDLLRVEWQEIDFLCFKEFFFGFENFFVKKFLALKENFKFIFWSGKLNFFVQAFHGNLKSLKENFSLILIRKINLFSNFSDLIFHHKKFKFH